MNQSFKLLWLFAAWKKIKSARWPEAIHVPFFFRLHFHIVLLHSSYEATWLLVMAILHVSLVLVSCDRDPWPFPCWQDVTLKWRAAHNSLRGHVGQPYYLIIIPWQQKKTKAESKREREGRKSLYCLFFFFLQRAHRSNPVIFLFGFWPSSGHDSRRYL